MVLFPRGSGKELIEMQKIDRRRTYFIVLDTETANDMDNPLVYDCGWVVCDKHGTIYEKRSFVNREIFNHEREMMRSAYYAEKIPQYIEQLRNGERIMVNWYEIKSQLLADCKKWGVRAICAHNMRFDYKATATTQRWLTKSKYRYFFPKGIEIWDSLKMAQDTICKQKSYQKFCEKHGFMTKHRIPRPQATAEVLYRYITGKIDFIEEHKGLEDCLIEAKIVSHCFRQHKKMRKLCFEK